MSNYFELPTDDDLDFFDLTCPSCRADLLDDAAYVDWRICGTCNRHFWVSARERVQMFTRDAVFEELNYSEPVLDPLEQHRRLTPADRQEDIRERSGLADALVTGHLTLPQSTAVVAVLDPVLVPTGLGVVTTDKLIAAIKTAVDDRLPMVVICGGGSLPAGSGLLTSLQPLRMSGAIAELHRSGLPLIIILSHPSGGNVLTSLAINADIRLIEPGTAIGNDLVADEVVARPQMLARLDALLRAQADPPRGTIVTLAGSDDALSVSLNTFGSQATVTTSINTDIQIGPGHIALLRRGQRIAQHLELPLVVFATGSEQLALEAQLEMRDLILRHRRPTIGVLTGNVSGSVLNILAVDSLFGESSLSIGVGRLKSYTVYDSVNAGTIDGVIEPEHEEKIANAIDVSIRLSPARRYERRLRSIERRGSESSDSSETSTVELLDLREMQANLMRSVDDLRQRLEHRDFGLPSFGGLQSKPHMPQLHLPRLQFSKPALGEMREKWVARGKAAVSGSDKD